MPRYLIQLSHGSDHEVCVRALHTVQRYGGHLFTHVDWGCKAGVHSGWLIVEVDNLNAAMQMVPPEFREDVRIVELNKFTKAEIEAWAAKLDG